MTSKAFDEDIHSVGDALTLEEFLVTLSDSDKKLVKDLPLNVDELVMLTSEEFAGFRDKHLSSTKEQQNRRLQIIITLSRLAIYARLDKDARKEPVLVKEEYQSQSQSQIQSAEPYSQLKLFEKYNKLRTVTLENIPKLWPGLEFALSVKSILNIKCCTLPFAGIILGPASSLKTVAIELFRECHHTFYTDNFSAKAFVSHNSAVKKEKLKEIDMLPRIKNKFFLTPELAPTFAQREEELIQTLGIMTRILDGHGYESDTGAQGHRGYNENIMFAWLGAAVDIPHKVHRQLSGTWDRNYISTGYRDQRNPKIITTIREMRILERRSRQFKKP